MALEKAQIFKRDSNDPPVSVLFNPEQYTVNRDNNFAQMTVPGLRGPLLQFVSGGAQTLEMELLLDTVEAHRAGSRRINPAGADVRPLVKAITNLLDIDPATHAPPVLRFAWASFSFVCVLARATQQFIMFRADGAPVRAKLQVSFTELINAETEAKEVKRETADYTKLHVVQGGDSLAAIAFRLLGAPHLWRPIAIANGLENPGALAPGLRLRIPRLPFRDPDTGEIYGSPARLVGVRRSRTRHKARGYGAGHASATSS